MEYPPEPENGEENLEAAVTGNEEEDTFIVEGIDESFGSQRNPNQNLEGGTGSDYSGALFDEQFYDVLRSI